MTPRQRWAKYHADQMRESILSYRAAKGWAVNRAEFYRQRIFHHGKLKRLLQ